MKVEQLARLVGVGIEDVVARVLGATRSDGVQLALRPAVTIDTERPAATAEPPLAAMLGRASYRDIHRAIDRWLLGRVLDEARGNISHAADRLRVSRRTLRQRWARVRELALADGPAEPPPGHAASDGPPEPVPPSLAELLDRGCTYAEIRDAVDRWLLGCTLARASGNVTHAARQLGIVRKQVRERWARVRPQ